MKEQIWMLSGKYLLLSFNTQQALVLCIDTHVCIMLKFLEINIAAKQGIYKQHR